jgi:hypothetical protein
MTTAVATLMQRWGDSPLPAKRKIFAPVPAGRPRQQTDAVGAEGWRAGAVRRAEPLGRPCRRQALPLPFPLARGWELSARWCRSRCWRCSTPGRRSRCAAPELVSISVLLTRGTYVKPVSNVPQHCLAACFARRGLPENIADRAVWLHSAPQMMSRAVEREADFGPMPCVAWPGTAARMGLLLPAFVPPLPDGLIGHHEAVNAPEFLPSALAQAEAGVEPTAVPADLRLTTS